MASADRLGDDRWHPRLQPQRRQKPPLKSSLGQGHRNIRLHMPPLCREKRQTNRLGAKAGHRGQAWCLVDKAAPHPQPPLGNGGRHAPRDGRRNRTFGTAMRRKQNLGRARFQDHLHRKILHRLQTAERLQHAPVHRPGLCQLSRQMHPREPSACHEHREHRPARPRRRQGRCQSPRGRQGRRADRPARQQGPHRSRQPRQSGLGRGGVRRLPMRNDKNRSCCFHLGQNTPAGGSSGRRQTIRVGN